MFISHWQRIKVDLLFNIYIYIYISHTKFWNYWKFSHEITATVFCLWSQMCASCMSYLHPWLFFISNVASDMDEKKSFHIFWEVLFILKFKLPLFKNHLFCAISSYWRKKKEKWQSKKNIYKKRFISLWKLKCIYFFKVCVHFCC